MVQQSKIGKIVRTEEGKYYRIIVADKNFDTTQDFCVFQLGYSSSEEEYVTNKIKETGDVLGDGRINNTMFIGIRVSDTDLTLKTVIDAILMNNPYASAVCYDSSKIKMYKDNTAESAILERNGISNKALIQYAQKRTRRSITSAAKNSDQYLSHSEIVALYNTFRSLDFIGEGGRKDVEWSGDWIRYHRPSSRGGWEAIAPDNRGNNLYTTNSVVVKMLTRKYLA